MCHHITNTPPRYKLGLCAIAKAQIHSSTKYLISNISSISLLQLQISVKSISEIARITLNFTKTETCQKSASKVTAEKLIDYVEQNPHI
jgi:hypothetical protein